MSGILFDTSVYISALRQGDETILSLRRAARGHMMTRPALFGSAQLFFTNSILERKARGRVKNYSGLRENSSKLIAYSFRPASIGLPPVRTVEDRPHRLS